MIDKDVLYKPSNRFRRFIDSRNNAYVQDLDFEFL